MKNLAFLCAAFLLLMPGAARAANVTSMTDTDGDTLSDFDEDANRNSVMDAGETDPYNADTDGGGESDGSEVAARRNPFDPQDDMTYDADGDGLVNGIELLKNTDPKNADTDGDGLPDKQDAFPLDSKYKDDANRNQLPDEWEKINKLDQSQVPQTTVDDPDGDGLTNAEELARGSSPVDVDSDRDGTDDKTEVDHGGNPRENACLEYSEAPVPLADMADHWSAPFVSVLSQTRILPDKLPLVRGYTAGRTSEFRPDQPVTRYEFLKMVMLGTCTKLRSIADESRRFSDVRTEARATENADIALRRRVIYTAVHYGVVEGYDDGTFRPDAPVNRAEALKILKLAARLDDTEADLSQTYFSDVAVTDWFHPYVVEATVRAIVTGHSDGTFRPADPITRAEAAKIVLLTMRQNPWTNGYVLPE